MQLPLSRFWVSGLSFRVLGFEFGASDIETSLGFRVFGVCGVGFRVRGTSKLEAAESYTLECSRET